VPDAEALASPSSGSCGISSRCSSSRRSGNFFLIENKRQPGSQGSLRLGTFESGIFDLSQRVDLLIIDGADKIPGFHELWHQQILPVAEEWGMRVCAFGRARGGNNGFGRLCLEYRDQRRRAARRGPVGAQPGHDRGIAGSMAAQDAVAELAQDLDGEILVGQQLELTQKQQIIGDDETFVDWCDRLARTASRSTASPSSLDDRPAMRWIYEQVPSTPRKLSASGSC
jgi:hypothetical protein